MIGFNRDVYEKKRKKESMIGKWYVIYSQSSSYAGKIKQIYDEEIILNPYKGYTYDIAGNRKSALIQEDLEIRVFPEVFKPISEELLKKRILNENKEMKNLKDKITKDNS